jgi:hypothetical protein
MLGKPGRSDLILSGDQGSLHKWRGYLSKVLQSNLNFSRQRELRIEKHDILSRDKCEGIMREMVGSDQR